MDEKLVKAIIKALQKKGNNGLTKLFELDTEDGIADAISGLNLDSDKSLSDLIKDGKYQSEFDKYVSKALKTREDKLKDKYNFVKKDSFEDEDDEEEEDDDDKKRGKSNRGETRIEKQLRELRDIVLKQDREHSLQKSKVGAKKLLSDNNIPEKFVKFFDFSDEEKSLETQFEGIKNDYEDIKKSVSTDLGVHTEFPAPSGGGMGKPDDKEISDIVDNL